MRHVLFVCTGNIFRSLTAEYALRHVLGAPSNIIVASAGTEDFPQVVSPLVKGYLLARGLDVSRHRRRTLTAQLLEEPDLVIAMSTEHRSVLAERFDRRDVPLFTEACAFPASHFPMWTKSSEIMKRTPLQLRLMFERSSIESLG